MTNNNVQNIKFLRNGVVFTPSINPVKTARQVALDAMEKQKENLADGTAILGRYKETDGVVKTLVGFAYISDDAKTLTVFDVDGAGADVDKKIKTAIQALDADVTSSGGKNVQVKVTEEDGKIKTVNITTDNTVNSGDVASAIKTEIDKLDYTDSAVPGQYVSQVSQTNGKIAVERAALPTVGAFGEAGKPITAVSENLGAVSAATGTINAEHVNVTGSVFTSSTVQAALEEIDTEYKAADAAIVGNASVTANTLAKLEGIVNNLSTNAKEYSIKQITEGLSANVKEAWGLFDAYNHQSGATINIYKDSAYKEIYLGTADDEINTTTGDITKKKGDKQSLNYAYMKADETYDLVKVDVSAFLSEEEFKDGLQVSNHEVSVKVDTSSEKVSTGEGVTSNVLTVSTDGVKVSNIQNAIDYSISKLDANVTGGTTAGTKTNGHIQVVVDEVDGKLTAVTVNEANIADADKLTDLSGKTVTAVAMTGGTANIVDNDSDGTNKITINTDGSQIFMTGYAKGSDSGAVADSDSINVAIGKLENQIVSKVDALNATVSGETTDGKVNVKVTETNGVITAVNVVGTDIASASALTAEIEARKAVDGQSGQIYAANANVNYIGKATSLNDADVKLDAALKAVDDAMLTVVAASYGITVSNKEGKSQTISAKVNKDGGIVNDEKGLHLGTIDCGTY